MTVEYSRRFQTSGIGETDMMDSGEGLRLMVVARLKGNVREWR